jgi:transposase
MAHYKTTEKDQGQFLPVQYSEQILPGTFEHTLRWLIDEKYDLSVFDLKYSNDFTGAAAIQPKILLKIILYCYHMGIISSRKIARACETNMVVKALAEGTEPHYTTISDFVSGMPREVEKVFSEVLLVCDEMELVGGKTYATDGCKLPSNASKEWSGTKKELGEKYENLKKISREIVERHRENDRAGKKEREADEKKLEKLEKAADKIFEFLETHGDRRGARGTGGNNQVERDGQREREDKGPSRCDPGVQRDSGGGRKKPGDSGGERLWERGGRAVFSGNA